MGKFTENLNLGKNVLPSPYPLTPHSLSPVCFVSILPTVAQVVPVDTVRSSYCVCYLINLWNRAASQILIIKHHKVNIQHFVLRQGF